MKHASPVDLRSVMRLAFAALVGALWFGFAPVVIAAAPFAPSQVKVGMSRVDAFSPERQLYLVQWQDNSLNESYFLIQARAGTTGSFVSITLASPDEEVTTVNLGQVFPAGTRMYFRVVAVSDPTTGSLLSGDETFSTPSAAGSVLIPNPTTFNAPTNLTSSITGDGLIRLAWTDNSTTEEVFEVQYKRETEADTAYQSLTTLFLEQNPFEGTLGLKPGGTYHLRIRALKGSNGTSYAQATGFSNVVTVAVPSLAPPTGLTVTAIDEDSVRLTWTDNSHNEGLFYRTNAEEPIQGGFAIYLNINSSGFQELGTVGANVETVSEINVPPGAQLAWKVRARWSDGTTTDDSADSAATSITTEFKAPTEMTAAVAGPSETPGMTRIHLTWKDNSLVEGGYEVETGKVLPNTNITFASAGYSAPNATQLTVDVPHGAESAVRVRAVYSYGGTIFGSTPTGAKTVAVPNGITTTQVWHPAIKGTPIQTFTLTHGTGGESPALSSWYMASGPSWASFDTNTGELTGTPTKSGIQKAVFFASFVGGSTDTHEVTFRVQEPEAQASMENNPTSRIVPLSETISIPLNEIFKDLDSPSAVRVNTAEQGFFDIILQDHLTPQTVANFMSYVNAGDYNGVAVHRAVPGFVIQMGGYKPTAAASPDYNFTEVAKRPSPLNEPGIRNVRRTVAMAKQEGNPNSATHDFFVSVADNTENLDLQNGGFTVFGRVPASQMSVPDSIISLANTYNIATYHNALRALQPRDRHRIKLPSGTSTVDVDFDFWPHTGQNVTPVVAQVFNTVMNDATQNEPSVPVNVPTNTRGVNKNQLVTMTSVAPVPVLSFGSLTNSNPTDVAVALNNNDTVLNITGQTDFGTSNIAVTATDLDGNTTTYNFDVTVDSGYTKAVIDTQPISATKDAGVSHTFTVAASGTDLFYQWRKNGFNLSGANSSTLNINPVALEDQGSYQVIVSNAANVVASATVTLTVNAPAQITREPLTQTLAYGSAATFIVAAKGSGNLSYQWRKDGFNIAGATSPTYTIAPLKMTDAGDFTCVVTNSFGSDTSAVATLTVTETDQDNDGVPDHEEVALGSDRFDTDSDDDGYSDAMEVEYGSNPANASSTPAATIVIAQVEREKILRNIAMRRVPAKAGFQNTLTGSPVNIPEMWLSTYEVSNAEWAAILQHAREVMSNVVSIVQNGPDKEIHMGGNVVCRVPTHKAADPGGLGVDEVTLSADQSTFLVARSVADHPARGITWYGAYLAARVLNDINGYNTKTDSANLSFIFETSDGMGGFVPVNGFHIPRFYEWEHAARSNTANQLYATGATISGTRANYAITGFGKPKLVSSHLPNAGIGCFNLAGNVSEWIFETDVNTAGNGFTRGGGYDDPESDLQNDAKKSRARNSIHPSVGIRLALVDNRAPASPTHPAANVIVKTGSPIVLTGNAVGAPPLQFQWYLNDKAVPGQTSRILNIPSAVLANGGRYKLQVKNGLGKLTTNESLVTVVESVPSTVYVKLGGTATLTAKTRGSSILQFRWRKDELPLDNDQLTKGVTTRTLKAYGPTIEAIGYYDCRVTGPGSSGNVLTGETLVVYVSKPYIEPPTTIPPITVGGSFSLGQRYASSINLTPTSWKITGLPPGMTYDPKTGIITGRPTKPGVYIVKVVASNAEGSSATIQYAITVEGFPARSIGQFVARVDAGTATGDDLGGRLELTTTATGTFTGSAWINAIRYPITGTLTTDAITTATDALNAKSRATITIPRGGSLPAMQLSLILDPATNGLTGTLGPIIPPATQPLEASKVAITGWRNVWSSSNLATARAGRQNIRFSIPDTAQNDPATPQGEGFASLTVSPTGGTTLTGRAADGSLIGFSSVLGPTGEVLLYQLPYGANGSLLGTLQVADTTQLVTGTVRWYKKSLGPSSTERNYKDGFGPLDLTANGVSYTAPATGSIIVGFPNLADNAKITLSPLRLDAGGTTLEDSATSIFRINTNHSTTLAPAGAAITVTELRITPGAGTFTGKVSLTDTIDNVTREASFNGIFIRNSVPGQTGFGYGYMLLPHLPGTSAEPLLSARVFIEKNP